MKRFLTILAIISVSICAMTEDTKAQEVREEKKVIAFVFGTVHPLNADRKPLTDGSGNPVSVEMALGTGFFVSYPNVNHPGLITTYFVTAKHVLRDFDGTFLPKIKLRLNLTQPTADTGFDFISDLPVLDQGGNLLWLHDYTDSAEETVAFPLLPDNKKYDFKTIPSAMFVDDAELKSDAVAEGDNLFFVGLLAQYYGMKRNYPVTRRGTLALMTDESMKTPSGPQKLFIAELQSWPGNSGSPVFLNLGGVRGNALMLGQKLKLMGILLGTYTNRSTGSIVGHPDATYVGGNDLPIGVSFIIPATHIQKLLDSPEAQQLRELEIRQRHLHP